MEYKCDGMCFDVRRVKTLCLWAAQEICKICTYDCLFINRTYLKIIDDTVDKVDLTNPIVVSLSSRLR